MCSPCGPMVCYKYEDCGPAKGKASDGANRAEEGGATKKSEKENQLKRTKSRELRGGIMYYSCHCIKRNGLQHDCRRTGCGGEPACLALPDPLCAPSQLARARGLADPAALAGHLQAQAGGSSGGSGSASGSGSGRKFIVCELKGVVPDVSADKSGKCCKCPAPRAIPVQSSSGGNARGHSCICTAGAAAPKSKAPPPISAPANSGSSKACCCASGSSAASNKAMYVFDEKMVNSILKRFENKELAAAKEDYVIGPGGRPRKATKPAKQETCTRPGCVHWQPPPPCVWDLPCKADCFEAHPGIQPGRNPLSGGGGSSAAAASSRARGSPQARDKMKLLTPECCAGCCAPGGGGSAATGGAPAAGLPVMVMKLC